MIRITHVSAPGAALTLKVEGKLLEPWVDELLQACTGGPSRGQPIQLDLSALHFVDAAGARLLRDLIRQGIQVTKCSGYVAELLNVEKR
jgi:hypothetical protein